MMEKKTANNPKSVLMIITSMLIFGTIGIFRRYIPLSSAFLACSRGLLGGIFILIFIKLRRGGDAQRLPKKAALWLAATGALIGVNWMLLFEAYNHTTVAVATLCYYMQPTIVVLLSPLIFKEKLTAKKAVCALVAIIGMVFVSGVVGGAKQTGSPKGIILGLLAAVFYAAVVIMNKRISGIDAYQKTTIQLLSAGIVMIPYLLLTKGLRMEALTTKTVVLLLVVGLVHTGIAYLLYFGSMDGLKAQSIAIFSYIDPVSALFFSAILLKEPLSMYGMIGAVMIIGSALISELELAFFPVECYSKSK